MGPIVPALGTLSRRVLSVVLCLVVSVIYILPGAAEPAPVNLDLSSTERTVRPHPTQPASINAGGAARTICGADALTAAERIALMQVLQTGTQTIKLGAGGNAIGGYFTLNSPRCPPITNLVIPSGVTAVRNFGTAGALSLGGNLTNDGAFYCLSTSPGVQTAVIQAQHVLNNSGATISTILPAGVAVAGVVANLSLSLNALKDIINSGLITSSGSLSISAGGSIINSVVTKASASTPIISAANNLTLLSGSITNSGLIASLSSNVNISAPSGNGLQVKNSGGTIQALQGGITFGDPQYAGKSNIDITGGNLLSKAVNVFNGEGIAALNVQDLTGILNVRAGEVNVSASTSNLMLGNLEISGDPTFFNILGDVTIDGPMNFPGQNLAVVAARNITSNTLSPSTITTNGRASGGAITLIAGANLVSSGDASGGGGYGPTITLTGPSATGGKIDLTGGSGVNQIDGGGANYGKNVLVCAFRGSNDDSGMIWAPATDIVSSGSNTCGNVSVYGGNHGGNAVSVRNITTYSSNPASTGGSIKVAAAQPKLASGTTAITITDGQLSSDLTSGEVGTANVSIGLVKPNARSDVFIQTNGNLLLPSQTIDASSTTSGGTIALIFGNYSITGAGGLSLKANGSSQGGKILVRGAAPDSDITVDSSNLRVSVASTGGSAGSAAILAGRNLTVNTDGVSAGTYSAGGHLLLAAGMSGNGALCINGNLDVSGKNQGAGGSIGLVSSSTTPFTIDSSETTANGINGTVKADAASGSGGMISIVNRNTGGVTLSNTSYISAIGKTSGKGGAIIINDADDFTLPITVDSFPVTSSGPTNIKTSSSNALIEVHGTGVSGSLKEGGLIDIGGTSLVVDGPALKLRASGQYAGTININVADLYHPSSLSIGTGSGQVSIENRGITSPGQGVGLLVSGNLTVDASALEVYGTTSGPILNFVASGNIKINGSLDASGHNGSGGSITLTSGYTSTEQFVIGGSGANGISGTLAANAGIQGDGGKISVLSSKGLWLPSPSSIRVVAARGNGGRITLATEDRTGLPISYIYSDAARTPTTLTIGAGTLSADANLGGGNQFGGGMIVLTAGYINVTGGLLRLSANGVASDAYYGSSGGMVAVSSSYGSLDIGRSITISANVYVGSTIGSGHGGFVEIFAGKDLTISSSAINARPADTGRAGAFYLFEAGLTGPGNLKITGDLDVSASNVLGGFQDGGCVVLVSNSSYPFLVGWNDLNGISGRLIANGGGDSGKGGEIQIVNMGSGGVSVPDVTWLNVLSSNGTGGYINLGDDVTPNFSKPLAQPSVVSGCGPLSLGGGELNVNGTGSSGGTGGIVRLAGSSINLAGSNLSIAANSNTVGGGVYITTTHEDISIGTGAGQIQISAVGKSSAADPTYRSVSFMGTGLLNNIVIASGGGLTVDSSALRLAGTANDWGVSSVSLSAGTGSLVTNGSFHAGESFVARGGTCASCAVTINGSIFAHGITAGKGGSIEIDTVRNGPITISGDLDVETFSSAIPAGSIRIGPPEITPDVPGGIVTLNSFASRISARGYSSGQSRGGNVVINAKRLIIGSRNISINVDSSTSIGEMGSVRIRADGPDSSVLIGAGAGQISLSMRGVCSNETDENGAVIPTNGLFVVAGKDITVAPAAISTGYSYVCSLDLHAGASAPGNLFISGPVSTRDDGIFSLESNSLVPFTVGSGAVNNGVSGGLDAGQITIKNKGSGGISVLGSSYLTIWGTLVAGAIDLDARFGEASGGPIILGGGTYSLGQRSKVGSFSVRGGSISTTGAVVIAAGGGDTWRGNGGSIVLEQYGANSLGIGTAYGLRLSAHSGSTGGSGGTISVLSGGDLNVDVNLGGLDAAPRGTDGDGAHLSFAAGTASAGKLFINGSLSAGGTGKGNGGSISLSSNSTEAFSVNGLSCQNCIAGMLSATAAKGAGGSILISNAGGGVVIDNTSDLVVAPAAFGSGGTISISAKDDLRMAHGAAIQVNATGGDNSGGTLSLTASNLIFPLSGVFLSANGAGTGAAGSVGVHLTSRSADLAVAQSGLSISAQGAGADDVRNIVLESGRRLTVDPAALRFGPGPAVAGNGGHVELTAAAEVLVQGELHADGNISGSGGAILIKSTSDQVFVVGGGPGIENGSYGGLSANAAAAADGSAVGRGGIIDIRNYCAPGANPGAGGITVSSINSLSVTTIFGGGGSIVLDASGTATGTIAGPLSIAPGTYDVSGRGGSYSGGQIVLSGSTITGAPLMLVSRGNGYGSGGAITVKTSDPAANLVLDGSNFLVDVRAGTSGGSNGKAEIVAGGNLSILSGGLLYKTGILQTTGATLLFEGQNVHIQSYLDVSGAGKANGGSISIISDSSIPFAIDDSNSSNGCVALVADSGVAIGNGVDDDSGIAGSISVINNGSGGITVAGPTRLMARSYPVVTPSFYSRASGGKISLLTEGALTMSVSSTDSKLSADSGTGQGKAGSIDIEASRIVVEGSGPLILSAFGTEAHITVVTTGTEGDISVGNGAGQLIVVAESPQWLPLSELPAELIDGGTVRISASRNLLIDSRFLSINCLDTAAANGGHITLSAGTAGTGDLQITGDLRADGLGFGNAGTIDLTYSSSSAFTIGQPLTTGKSGITGKLSADLLPIGFTDFMVDLPRGSGQAGTITIQNSCPAAVDVSVTSSVSATTYLKKPQATGSASTGGSVMLVSLPGSQPASLKEDGPVSAAVSTSGITDFNVRVNAGGASFVAGRIEAVNFNVVADHVDFLHGNITASAISLQPRTMITLVLGSPTHDFTCYISAAEFANMQAPVLVIGNSSQPFAGVSLGGNIDLSGLPDLANISIKTSGHFAGQGFDFIAPGRQVSIQAEGISVGKLAASSLQLTTANLDVSAALLTAGSILFQGTGGSFGTITAPLALQGLNGSLTVSGATTRNGSAYLSAGSGILTITGFSTRYGSLDVTSQGSIILSGDIAAATSLRSNSGITAASQLSIGMEGTSTNFAVAARGSIALDAYPVTVLGNSITVRTSDGDIRINGASAASLSLTAGASGAVTVSNAFDGLLMLSASTAGRAFQLTTTGPLTTSTVSGMGVVLSCQGNLTLGGSITSNAQAVSLTAGGSGSIIQNAGTITSNGGLSLTSGTGNIGDGTAIRTQASGLSAQTAGAGSVNILNSGYNGTLMLGQSSAGSSFTLVNSGDVNVSGAVTAPSVTITGSSTSSNFSVLVNADIGNGDGVVTLVSKGTGAILDPAGAGTVRGTNVVLSAYNSRIGAVGQPVFTATSQLSLSAGLLNSSIVVSNTGDLTITAAGAVNLIDVTSTGNIIAQPSLLAITVNLTVSGNGSIDFKGSLGKGGGPVSVRVLGDGAIIQSTPAAKLTGTTVALYAANGNIGSDASPIISSTSQLSAQAGGSGSSCFVSNTGNVSLQGSGASNRFQLTDAGSITLTDSLRSSAGGSIVLKTLNSGKIQVNASLGAPGVDITLVASGTGAISALNNTVHFIGENISLSSGSADIGSTAVPLTLSAHALSANTSVYGKIFLLDDIAVHVKGCSAGTSFSLVTGNSITVDEPVTAGSIVLQLASGDLSIGANVGKPGAVVSLTSTGGGTITSTGGTVIGSRVTVSNGTGDIGQSRTSRLQTATQILTAGTNGANVFVANAGTLTNLYGKSTSTFDVSSSGSITTSSALSSGIVSLSGTSTNASIMLGADVTGSTSVALAAKGSGTILQSAAAIKVSTPLLDLRSDSGSIGFAYWGINVPSGSVSANTLGTVFISSTGSISLGACTGSSIQVVAKQINAAGDLHGNAITLRTISSGGGSISISGNVAGLTRPRAASISMATAAGDVLCSPSSTLAGNSVVLSSTSGAITARIATGADLTTFTANTSGNVGLTVLNDGGGSVSLGASTGNSFDVSQSGGASSVLTVAGPLTVGAVNLQWGPSGGSTVVLNSAIRGTRAVTIQTDGSIGQSVAGPVYIISPNVSLLSNAGSVGSPSKILYVSSGSLSSVKLSTQSQGGVFLYSSSPVTFKDNYVNTGAQFRLVSAGNILFGSGSQIRSGSISLSAAGSIKQTDSACAALDTANAVLSAGSAGIGSTGQSLLFDNTVSAGPVQLTITTPGSAFLSGVSASACMSFAGTSYALGSGGFNIQSLGTIAIGSRSSLATSAGPISLTASGVTVDGSVIAGLNTVTLNSIDPCSVIVVAGTGGNSTDFNLSTATLTRIKGGTLLFGSTAHTGAISVQGNLNVSGAGENLIGTYNLAFQTAGDFSSAGTTISLGPRNLTINGGNSVKPGQITGSWSKVSLSAASGDLALNGDIIVGLYGAVTLTADNGAILLGSSKVGGGTNTILKANHGRITGEDGNRVSGTGVTLFGAAGVGSDLHRIAVNATNLTLTGGNTFVSAMGNSTVGTQAGADASLPHVTSLDLVQTSAAGNATITTAFISAGSLRLAFSNNVNGSIFVGNNLAVTGDARLEARGRGTITLAPGRTISAGSLYLISETGTIGTAYQNIVTNAAQLQLDTRSSAYVTATNPLELTGTCSAGTLQLTDTAISGSRPSILLNTALVTDSAVLRATNAVNGSIVLADVIVGLPSSRIPGFAASVTLQATGAGSLFTTTRGCVDSVVTTSLSAGSGGITGDANMFRIGQYGATSSINFSSKGPVSLICAGNLELAGACAGSGDGGVTIASQGSLSFKPGATLTSSGSMTVGGVGDVSTGTISCSGTLFLNSSGRLTAGTILARAVSIDSFGSLTTGIITTTAPQSSDTGNVYLRVMESGDLTIGGNITASGGYIGIWNSGISGSIVFNPNVKLNTLVSLSTAPSNGSIYVTIGQIPDPFAAGTKPANLNVITAQGGKVFFGDYPSGIVVAPPAGASAAIAYAKGRNIYFNTTDPARTIKLSQGVLLKADPPAPVEGSLTQRVGDMVVAPIAVCRSAQNVVSMPGGTQLEQAWHESISGARAKAIPILRSGGSHEVNNLSSTLIEPLSPVWNAFADASRRSIGNPNEGSGELMELNDSVEETNSASPLTPIAFVSPMGVSDHQMAYGSVLFCPRKAISIYSRFGEIHLSAGAVVLIVSRPTLLAIYDLHDSHCVDVVLKTSHASFALSPGQHITLTNRSVDSYAQVDPFRTVAHRKMRVRCLDSTTRLFTSEFSLVSVMNLIRQMAPAAACEGATYRRVLSRLIKNAAIIQTVQQSSGSYMLPGAAGKS